MKTFPEEVYEMQKWSDEEILDELKRPCFPGNDFQYMVLRESIARIFAKAIKPNKE